MLRINYFVLGYDMCSVSGMIKNINQLKHAIFNMSGFQQSDKRTAN